MRELIRRVAADAGLELGDRSCQYLALYLEELLRWNERVNLTAITDPVEAIEKHLVDSLLLLPLLGNASRLLDIGSGAGLPGIPLQIVRPALGVVSVDSVGKKINFQRHVKRLCHLQGLQPVKTRMENLAEYLPDNEKFDLITARAFASLEKLVCLAEPWLTKEGRVLAMKGPEGEREACVAKELLGDVGMRVAEIRSQRLPISGSERQVLVIVRENGFV